MRLALCVAVLAACTGPSGGGMIDASSMDGSGGIDGGMIGTGGTGGSGGMPCGGRCSAPSQSTVCITGTLHSFEDPTFIPPPTPMYGLVVKIYDPIAFLTNPAGTQPAAVADIGENGCFAADGVPRFSSGLVTIVADDAPGNPEHFVPTAVSANLQANRNVTGVVAYFLIDGALEGWNMEVGNPPNPNSFSTNGIWFGQYLDAAGNPVANVSPTRPGDDPPLSSVFCFNTDRFTMTTNHVTGSSGICGISPDAIEVHSGVCATGGCTCNGAPCAPVFPSGIGGTAPGVVFVQTFRATQ